MAKKLFTRDLGRVLLRSIAGAEESQASHTVREDCARLLVRVNQATVGEVYDFLVGISKLPTTALSSSFKILVNLEPYYSKPDEDVADEGAAE